MLGVAPLNSLSSRHNSQQQKRQTSEQVVGLADLEYSEVGRESGCHLV